MGGLGRPYVLVRTDIKAWYHFVGDSNNGIGIYPGGFTAFYGCLDAETHYHDHKKEDAKCGFHQLHPNWLQLLL